MAGAIGMRCISSKGLVKTKYFITFAALKYSGFVLAPCLFSVYESIYYDINPAIVFANNCLLAKVQAIPAHSPKEGKKDQKKYKKYKCATQQC